MKKTLLAVIVLFAQYSYGQTSATERNIEQIALKARKKVNQERNEFAKNAQATEILSDEDLNRNNSALIEQSLSTISGVQVDKRTNIGGQRIVIRGFGNDQKFNNWGVKMYWNNMPLTNAEGITLLDDVDFSYVNNIEVIKGPASTFYGGGIGGTVRFYSRTQNTKGTSIAQNTMLGSHKYFQSITQLNSSDTNYSLNVNYGHIETDGYRPSGNGLKNFVNINGEYKLNPKQRITLFASQGFSHEKVSGQISYNDYYAGIDNGNPSYIIKGSGSKIHSTRVGLGHIWEISKNFKNSTTVFYSSINQDRIADKAFEVSSSPNVGFRTTFQHSYTWRNFSNQLDFGAEVQNSRSQISNYRFTGTNPNNPLEMSPISKGSYFKYNNNQSNYFAIERLTYKPWDFTFLAGVSLNRINYDREDLLAFGGLVPGYNKDLSFSKDYKMVATPHFAVQKRWKNQIFNLSYSEGYNAPTASTSFVSGGTINTVNDDLEAEKAKMWDFSVHGLLMKTKFDYQISLFNIHVNNKLTQLNGTDSSNNVYSYWANTGNQKNKGLELSLGYNYTNESAFISKITPFVNYSHYDFKYTDFVNSGTDFSGKKVVGVPDDKYAIGIDFNTKYGIYLNNTFNYLGKVYSDFANENLVKDYSLLNMKLGYKKTFGKYDVDVFAIGNNLTNQKNYTFLFVGNNTNDNKATNLLNYADVNPGPRKAYFFFGLNLKYQL